VRNSLGPDTKVRTEGGEEVLHGGAEIPLQPAHGGDHGGAGTHSSPWWMPHWNRQVLLKEASVVESPCRSRGKV